MEQFPTINECDIAVTMLKLNKSPGLDGLPGEFYQTFWPELRTRFYNCLLQTFNDKNMTSSQKLSLITLIFKKGDKILQIIDLLVSQTRIIKLLLMS